MKNIFIFCSAALLFACNNGKNENAATVDTTKKIASADQTASAMPATTTTAVTKPLKIIVEGKEIDLGGSILVRKDQDKLKPGNDYIVLLTAPGGENKSTMVLSFLLTLKPGVYPVTGMSFRRGESPTNEMYGAMLGGKPKLTNYKVNITECKDLGTNNMGGHKWSISGTFDELTIPAAEIMLMDTKRNHPKEIKISQGSFSNLNFDDNWDEMMNAAADKMKK